MKFGLATKVDKSSKTTSKNQDYVMSENCDVIVVFPIYGQLGAIRKPDPNAWFRKTDIFSNNNLLSYKN